MKKIRVYYLFLILLVNFALSQAEDDNSTLWPLIDNYQDYSTVLPKPVDSTKPTVIEFEKSKNFINLNTTNLNNSSIDHQKSSKESINESSIKQSNQSNSIERTRASKYLSTAAIPLDTKLNKKRFDIYRIQPIKNNDLNTNTSIISGRSYEDQQAQLKSTDPFLDDKYLAHLSAYDRIKLKNEKFQYDNFFSLYDLSPHKEGDQDDDILRTQNPLSALSPTKNPYDEENQYPYQHLVQYRPADVLPLTAQYQQQKYTQQQPFQYSNQLTNYPQGGEQYYLPYEYPIPNTIIRPSTLQKFKKYQRQRIKELLHRPVQQVFAGKFKPDFVPKYMLEAPQRSHQQTGLGELFVVLGPLVILPLLSSFALSTFTTLYVTKSLIAKPAGATARHKQSNGKLLKEDVFNQTLLNLRQTLPDESLVYPFNASDYDIHLLNSKNNSINYQKFKKSDRKSDDNVETLSNQTFNKLKGESNVKQKEEEKHENNFKKVYDLKEESLKSLKISKRDLRQHKILKELGLDQSKLINEKPRKRIRRKAWNEVLWTRSKQNQSLWLPLTKKLARQPRNSLHSKLYIVRPAKKVYKKMISKDHKLSKNSNENLTRNQDNHNFNQPSDLLHFAINDAIANAKQLANFESKFDNDSEQKFNVVNYQSAASSPSPTYSNFSTAIEPNLNGFTNSQPKIYNLRTNGPLIEDGLQLVKRRNSVNQFNGDTAIEQNHKSISSNFPISTLDNKNDTIFQRITVINPFNTPSFLMDKQNSSAKIAASNQARSKNARKFDLNDNSKKDLDREVFDTSLEDWNEDFNNHPMNKNYPKESQEVTSGLNSDFDVIQKYLKQTRPDGDVNDEIVATYLSCNGLLNQNNQCLQRLVCQYVDTTIQMPDLEKEVASLIIYAILKNKYIDDEVKQSMRKAAQDKIIYQQKQGHCSQYQCLRNQMKPNRTN